ncbi:hypothetical protein V1512DRAFT_261859 [Lipomyces arxii]|uniref:uncharacterized protein n=1 Tax=Lipomyces arxii TaxID=56418 RepID=UPI0034CFE274
MFTFLFCPKTKLQTASVCQFSLDFMYEFTSRILQYLFVLVTDLISRLLRLVYSFTTKSPDHPGHLQTSPNADTKFSAWVRVTIPATDTSDKLVYEINLLDPDTDNSDKVASPAVQGVKRQKNAFAGNRQYEEIHRAVYMSEEDDDDDEDRYHTTNTGLNTKQRATRKSSPRPLTPAKTPVTDPVQSSHEQARTESNRPALNPWEGYLYEPPFRPDSASNEYLDWSEHSGHRSVFPPQFTPVQTPYPQFTQEPIPQSQPVPQFQPIPQVHQQMPMPTVQPMPGSNQQPYAQPRQSYNLPPFNNPYYAPQPNMFPPEMFSGQGIPQYPNPPIQPHDRPHTSSRHMIPPHDPANCQICQHERHTAHREESRGRHHSRSRDRIVVVPGAGGGGGGTVPTPGYNMPGMWPQFDPVMMYREQRLEEERQELEKEYLKNSYKAELKHLKHRVKRLKKGRDGDGKHVFIRSEIMKKTWEFPLSKVKTWNDLRQRLIEGFTANAYPLLMEGCYEIRRMTDGVSILPSVWSETVKEGVEYEIILIPPPEPKDVPRMPGKYKKLNKKRFQIETDFMRWFAELDKKNNRIEEIDESKLIG